MGLDKSIEHRKERRKPYRGSKAIDKSCRNHGGGCKRQCEWCLGNRMHKYEKKMQEDIKDLLTEMNEELEECQ